MKATATLVLAAALGFGLAYSFSSAPAVAQGFPSSTFGGSGSLNRPSTDATLKSLSASTVTASTSVTTPDIKGAGGQDRILLPSGDTTTIKGGTHTANFVTVTGTASGSGPTIAAAGSDTNIDLTIASKGTGVIVMGNAQVCAQSPCVYGLQFSGGANTIKLFGAGITFANGSALSACDVNHRGQVSFVASNAGVQDHFSVCAKDAADAYAWRNLY